MALDTPRVLVNLLKPQLLSTMVVIHKDDDRAGEGNLPSAKQLMLYKQQMLLRIPYYHHISNNPKMIGHSIHMNFTDILSQYGRNIQQNPYFPHKMQRYPKYTAVYFIPYCLHSPSS